MFKVGGINAKTHTNGYQGQRSPYKVLVDQ